MNKQNWISLIENSICCECQNPEFSRLLLHISNFFDSDTIEEFAKFVADEEAS